MKRINANEVKPARPLRLVLYGEKGIGKTSMAAQFPNPVLIDLEDGGSQVAKRSKTLDWITEIKDLSEFDQVLDYELKSEKSKTVIIDSLDWLEAMVHASIFAKYKVDNLNNVPPGYGAGYGISTKMHDEIRKKLNEINKTKHLIIIAHPKQYLHHAVDVEAPYLRDTLKCHDKVSALFMEWADGLFYLKNDLYTVGKGKEARVQDTGRFLFTSGAGKAFDAKTRAFSMPQKIELKENGMFEIINGYFNESDEHLYEGLLKDAEKIKDQEIRKKALLELPKYKDNKEKLKEIQKYLEGK